MINFRTRLDKALGNVVESSATHRTQDIADVAHAVTRSTRHQSTTGFDASTTTRGRHSAPGRHEGHGGNAKRPGPVDLRARGPVNDAQRPAVQAPLGVRDDGIGAAPHAGRWDAGDDGNAGHKASRWYVPFSKPKQPSLDDPAYSASLLERIGRPTLVSTHRASEVPYGIPNDGRFTVTEVPMGRAIDLDSLDPTEKYLWTIDTDGLIRIAPERQEGFGVNPLKPNGRRLKHGDLNPGHNGAFRGYARLGGMLEAAPPYSRERWVMDDHSSYAFQRVSYDRSGRAVRQSAPDSDSMRALRELLRTGGTDVDDISFRDHNGRPVKSR